VEAIHIAIAESESVAERSSELVVRTGSAVDTPQDVDVVSVDHLVRICELPEQIEMIDVEAADE
jgi:hypothetical protein